MALKRKKAKSRQSQEVNEKGTTRTEESEASETTETASMTDTDDELEEPKQAAEEDKPEGEQTRRVAEEDRPDELEEVEFPLTIATSTESYAALHCDPAFVFESLFHSAAPQGSLVKHKRKAGSFSHPTRIQHLSKLLLLACHRGDMVAVRRLVEQGGVITHRNSMRESATFFGAKHGIKFIKELHELGAPVTGVSVPNTTVIHQLLTSSVQVEVADLEWLMAKGTPLAPNEIKLNELHFAAQYDRVGLIPFLSSQGVDLNCENDFGSTPLMYAIRYRASTATINALLDLRVSISARSFEFSRTGDNALHLAARAGEKHKDLMLRLISMGANLRACEFCRKKKPCQKVSQSISDWLKLEMPVRK